MFLNKKRKFQIKLKLARKEYNFLLQGMAVDLYFLKVIIMIKTIIKTNTDAGGDNYGSKEDNL